jgi:cysteine desulfurase / selenocysteine lyase
MPLVQNRESAYGKHTQIPGLSAVMPKIAVSAILLLAANALFYSMDQLNSHEVARLRAETRGASQRIHFNNAGSSLPPDVVVDTTIRYLTEEAVLGGYEADAAFADQLDQTYTLIARLINADPNEIALVESASVAWSLAFNGIDFAPGDVVIASEFEYATNILGFHQARKRFGVEIRVIAGDDRGNFSTDALQDAISPRTKLIAVTHVASTAGGVIPVADIGKIARKHGILYLVDACQSVGQMPVDVREIGCDMLSVTGRKYLRAPRGTGFLYVRKEVQDTLKLIFLDGHSTEWISEDGYQPRGDAKRFELFEKNRGLVLGLGKAVEYALDIGVDRIWQRIEMLGRLLRTRLSAIPGVTIHDSGDQLSGIVTFSVKDMEDTSVKNKLAKRGINVSVGVAGSTLYYMNRRGLSSVVRASVHYFNTEEEITLFCDALSLL